MVASNPEELGRTITEFKGKILDAGWSIGIDLREIRTWFTSNLEKPSQGDGLAADEDGVIYITEIANNR